MRITICGSMKFAKEMKEAKDYLESAGHFVILPELVEKFIKHKTWQKRVDGWRSAEGARLKKKYDLIKKHYEKIKESDAILVVNYEKKGIKNYIGGNSFLEMGFAYILNKKIYLLNDIPKLKFYREEIMAMDPIVLNGDLSKIK